MYDAYVVYFRRNGVKREVLANSRVEANRIRRHLKKNRRKFLGMRPVVLAEIDPVSVKYTKSVSV